MFMEGKKYTYSILQHEALLWHPGTLYIYASKYTYIFRRSQQQKHYFVLKVSKNKLQGSGTTTVCLFFLLSSLKWVKLGTSISSSINRSTLSSPACN